MSETIKKILRIILNTIIFVLSNFLDETSTSKQLTSKSKIKKVESLVEPDIIKK